MRARATSPARFPGGELGPALRPVTVPVGAGTADDLYIAQEEFRAVFAADVPEDVATLLAVTQRPIIADALADKARKDVPSWNLVTLQDLAVPAESQRFMGERAGSRAVEVDASHAVTVSRPDVVAQVIEEAASETSR